MPTVPGPQTSCVMSTSTSTQTLSPGVTLVRPACLARIFSVRVIAAMPDSTPHARRRVVTLWAMPDVNVRITAGATRGQKARLVADVTRARVEGLGKRPEHVHVVIHEVAEENWGFAGMLTDDHRRRVRGDEPAGAS